MGKSDVLLPADHLLPGPGLTYRWLAAVPLMLVATALPVLGGLVLRAWVGVSSTIIFPDEDPPTFAEEFGDALGVVTPTAVAAAVVTLVFLVRRSMFAAWPAACVWLVALGMGPTVLYGDVFSGSGVTLPNLSLALGVACLNYWLGRAALWVLSRPVATDLVESTLEIPYTLPGSFVRLRVKHDRLVLDRLGLTGADKTRLRKVIKLGALREVKLTHQAEPTRWKVRATATLDDTPAKSKTIEVPAGPVLRIVASKEKWLIPIPEILGEDLATAISMRANATRPG